MNNKNPDNSTIRQVLADLRAMGVPGGTTIEQLEQLSAGKTWREAFDRKWILRSYNENRVKFTRFSKDNVIQALKPTTAKLFAVLASYANQEGLVSASRPDLQEMTEMSDKTLDNAFADLIALGLITVMRAGRGRGRKTVYQVNPLEAHSGKTERQRTEAAAFFSHCGDVAKIAYYNLKNKTDAWCAHSVIDKTDPTAPFAYNEIARRDDEKKEPVAGTTDPTPQRGKHSPVSDGKSSEANSQALQGQMTAFDVIGGLPE